MDLAGEPAAAAGPSTTVAIRPIAAPAAIWNGGAGGRTISQDLTRSAGARLLLAGLSLAASPLAARADDDARTVPPGAERVAPQVPLPFGVKAGAESEEPAAERPAERCEDTRWCAERLGRGSVCSEGRCVPYYDRRDLFGMIGLHKGPGAPPAALSPLVAAIPVISSSPASGLSLGVAGTIGMYLGDPADTTISSAVCSIWYTTKNQVMVHVASTAMTPRNEWELVADWRFYVYSQDTYGLGTGTSPLATGLTLNGAGALAAVDGAQPMDFDLVRMHQAALRHVAGTFYLGGGYLLDSYSGIVDERLDLGAATPVVTSHYAYSSVQGFDPRRYVASGLSVDAMSDSRDSTIAPYRGAYAHLAFAGFPTWLGSSQAATELFLDARTYLGLSNRDPRNLLALWVYASGVTSGRLPYLALPSSGWDALTTTGRGYVQGRFRGTAMVDLEAEWRFRLTADGLLGGTVFGSAQTFSRPAVSLPQYGYADGGEQLFDTVRPAGGAGLRIMLIKQSRTALRIDVAAGAKSFGFYLGSGEAF